MPRQLEQGTNGLLLNENGLISIESAEGMSVETIWKLYSHHVSHSQVRLLTRFGPGRHRVASAAGSHITLAGGKTILDLTGGIGVLTHGHNHPEILEARRKFADRKRMEVHKNFLSPYIAALSHNVAKLLPGDLNVSYFPNSGAEAVEGAVKLAYKYHKGARSLVLHSDISFHGKLLGAGSLTGSPEQHFRFPTIQGTESYQFDDSSDLARIIESARLPSGESNVYAVIVEPINASSMRESSPAFLEHLRRVCDKENIILIVDEVYSGWGKTGHLFDFMKVPGFMPDIVAYAKAFGGGKASISGYTSRETIARQAYDNLLDATLHSTTYNGFGEETATAIKAIEVLVRDDYPARAREIGAQFASGVGEAIRESPSIEEMRGKGALWGLIYRRSASLELLATVGKILPGKFLNGPSAAEKLVVASAVNYLFDEHRIMTYFGSNREKPLILSFPLVSSVKDVEHAIEAVVDLSRRSVTELIIGFVRSQLGQ